MVFTPLDMGKKKDTLLRWVNCCSELNETVDELKCLSDGVFFIQILSLVRIRDPISPDPWVQIMVVFQEYELYELIDFDAAASGNEDELSKLIVVCMHLTMVLKPCDSIKERTMWHLSTEDQKVIEAILVAIVNDDHLTRNKLVEVVQDVHETVCTPVMFYSSSPLSSMVPGDSPLKRFLDSPMAQRLSRLQKEINDKNEEIRRLQIELVIETDESTLQKQQMDDLKRKIKEFEKKNTELDQRLRDCQLPEPTPCPDTDFEINQLKKQLKRLQTEYESSCQQYCDLNMEYEDVKASQDKDRKQIRQLQIDLNDVVARFERESAEYQLKIDSVRTENKELKHKLEEKSQWIDLLEDKNRTYAETHSRAHAPRSPCRESIGYSLLSIETEKLQDERDAYKRELTYQSNRYESEKQQLEHKISHLEQVNGDLLFQLEQSDTASNESLQARLQQLSLECKSLRQERQDLTASLQNLNVEFRTNQKQLDDRIAQISELNLCVNVISRQLEDAVSAKDAALSKCAHLEGEKDELNFEKCSFEQMYLEAKNAFEEAEAKFQLNHQSAQNEIDAKNHKLLQLEDALKKTEQALENLRAEQTTFEAIYTSRIEALEAEKRQLLERQDRVELDSNLGSFSSEISIRELEAKLFFVTRELAEQVETFQQTELERKQVETEQAENPTSDFPVGENCQVENKMAADDGASELQAFKSTMTNLESAVDKLKSEIKELTCKKANLEQLQGSLETARAAAEQEAGRLRRDIELKSLEIFQLSERIAAMEAILERARNDNHNLQGRVAELESAVCALNQNAKETTQSIRTFEKQLLDRESILGKSSEQLDAEKERSARAQADFIEAMANIKSFSDVRHRDLLHELDSERRRACEYANRCELMSSAKNETTALVEVLQHKLAEMETEKNALVQTEVTLKQDICRLEETLNYYKDQFEQEKQELGAELKNKEYQLNELMKQLDAESCAKSGFEEECNRLKLDHYKSVADHFERLCRDVEASLKAKESEFWATIQNLEESLKMKEEEVAELSNKADELKLKLDESVHEKETLEHELMEKISVLKTEKVALADHNAFIEQQIQTLKAELAVEQSKTLQVKAEPNLEHRKEKAALEARLQLAQAQVKAMQEKLVNLTVANNSMAPLEHKINVLTCELDAATKAKLELEKRLAEALDKSKTEMVLIKNEDVDQQMKASFEAAESENATLRRKYEAARKALGHNDDVINHYVANFEKMQLQLDSMNGHIARLSLEKNKLAFENRSLKSEQQHLLARIAAEKDREQFKVSRHSLAMQRGSFGNEGGTLTDTMLDSRHRALRLSRSDVTTLNKHPTIAEEVFIASRSSPLDASALDAIFRGPAPNNRRESIISVCSNRSSIHLPQGAGRLFSCDDEDGEVFSNSYLDEMKEGKCVVADASARLSELQRRNSMQPPHMRSAYPSEMNDERLRQPDVPDSHNEGARRMSMLCTPPAVMSRKRPSTASWDHSGVETPDMNPKKRRSCSIDASFPLESRENNSVFKNMKRLMQMDTSQASYQKPDPRTPAKNKAVKENTVTSSVSSPKTTPKPVTKSATKRLSETQPSRTSKMTPASLVRKVHAKIRSNKQASSTSTEGTPSASRATHQGGSKLNIFCKSLGTVGSRGHT